GGDSMYGDAVTDLFAFTIDPALTSTTLQSPDAGKTVVIGQSVTLNAKVVALAPAVGDPTGSVEFFEGPTSVGTSFLNNGVASITAKNLTSGTHSFTGRFQSAVDGFKVAAYVNSTSAALAVTAGRLNPKISVTASLLTPVYGQTTIVTATISPGAGANTLPTGKVTFREAGTTLGTADLVAGIANLSLKQLGAGLHNLVATYEGDAIWNPLDGTASISVSTAMTASRLQVSLRQPDQVAFAVTVEPIAPGAGVPNGSVDLVDGSNNSVVASLVLASGAASQVLPLQTARRPLKAIYWGDQNFSGSTTAALPVAVNSASFATTAIAPDQALTLFGVSGLVGDSIASSQPLPLSLNGFSVNFTDSSGATRPAALFCVLASGAQINLVVPHDLVPGLALLTVQNPAGAITSAVTIAGTAPGIYAANADGRGVAVGQFVATHADGSQSFANTAVYDSTAAKWIPNAIDLQSESDQFALILYGTGIQHRPQPESVKATVGGQEVAVLFSGPQPSFPGLDQVNLQIPRNLTGRGTVPVSLTVDGKAANEVIVAIR
ncbi:MAG TPA: Ig-like domain repeat protein, partial [Candidatus Solibacter sp.]|nr:Ig-like domain repeat protein [Candidatus Solibacter sp.]